MRRLSLAMVALAIMGLMTMVSCRKPKLLNDNTVAPRTMTFNATTEMGTNKTSLDGLNVNWNAGDKLSINGESFTLSAGAGTTFASFTSDEEVSITEPYYAAYPASAEYTTAPSTLTFNLSAERTYDASTIDIPMAALNYSDMTTVYFKNVVNVLKLPLKGVDTDASKLTSIVLTSTTSSLNGHVAVTFDGDTPVVTAANGTNTTTLSFGGGLQLTSGKTTNVYIVLPKIVGGDLWVKLNCANEKYMEKGIIVTSAFNAVNNMFTTHEFAVNATTDPWTATVVTIPVCAVHATCASSGGVVTGTGVDEQGVCWGTSVNPTIAGSHYVHQYEYATGSLTPKNTTTDNTFTGFMSGLTPDATYHVRAYIRRGSEVEYGNDITFTTPLTEPFPTDQTVNFDLTEYPSLEWSKYNLGVDPNDLDEAYDWYGDWYQWGNLAACSTISSGTTYYVNCGWQSYRYAENGNGKFTKYCPEGSTSYWYSGAGSPDNKLQLDMTDDCVRQTLKGTWRLPTGGAVNTGTGAGEWQALYNGTLWVWTDHYNGITNLKGYVVYKVKAAAHKKQKRTSDGDGDGGFAGYGSGLEYTLSDSHMFLPSAGDRYGASLYADSYGNYWSSSLKSSNPIYAWNMTFGSGGVDPQNNYDRYYGFSVRPVR